MSSESGCFSIFSCGKRQFNVIRIKSHLKGKGRGESHSHSDNLSTVGPHRRRVCVGVCGRARPDARGLHEIVARESFNEGYDFQDVTKEERNEAKDVAFSGLFHFSFAGNKEKVVLSFYFSEGPPPPFFCLCSSKVRVPSTNTSRRVMRGTFLNYFSWPVRSVGESVSVKIWQARHAPTSPSP